MMKYGYNKILMTMVKLMAIETNEKEQKNLHMTITAYINKYGWFNFLFIMFDWLIYILIQVKQKRKYLIKEKRKMNQW